MQPSRRERIFGFAPTGTAEKNGSAYSLNFQALGGLGYNSIFPGYSHTSTFSVPFINGTSTTPSQVVFNNTNLGSSGVEVRATGTLYVGGGVKLN